MTIFIPPHLPDAKRDALMQVATSLLEAHQTLTQQHGALLHHLQAEDEAFAPFIHYPRTGDRIDYKSGAQYYYHCHREDMQREEHGHIHCFIRAKSIPDSMVRHASANRLEYDVSPMTHLVAIALNRHSQPIRLFTTNRWVTKEQWYDAVHLEQLTKQFTLSVEKEPQWRMLDQWVQGMVELFQPQIVWAQQARDRFIMHATDGIDSSEVYEDKSIEEWSSIAISLESQVQWLMDDSAHKEVS